MAGKSSPMSEATFITIDRRSQAVNSPSFNVLRSSFNASTSLSTSILFAYPTLDMYLLLGLFLNLPLHLTVSTSNIFLSRLWRAFDSYIAATLESYKCGLLLEARSTE